MDALQDPDRFRVVEMRTWGWADKSCASARRSIFHGRSLTLDFAPAQANPLKSQSANPSGESERGV